MQQQTNPKKPPPQKPQSWLCNAFSAAESGHLALSFDAAGAIGPGGALHVSVSPEGINVFVGAGSGGGGKVGFTVGPAFEVNTPSTFGFRTYTTMGGGAGAGGAATFTGGSNGVMVSGGGGLVSGAVAETGGGLDIISR